MADPPFSPQELYKGHGWQIMKEEASLPDGRVKRTARAHRHDSVHILAFTQDGNILMIREFRPFYHDFIWMVPSGKMDKEQEPRVAAQRELQEETGFSAKTIEPYCRCRHSEILEQQNHIFIAHHLKPDPLPQDKNELIELHEMPVSEAIDRVLASSVIHTVSAFALLRYAREHGE
ncbi:MAG: NUDIX hydrolase [Candidatus Peribacteraceae bacterium]|nr:NUDIX hydrolase [Candidatus Peribacteraceae bacterium]MDD5739742.1 NUDIX hydrolase [Candidatus Peribacteraceae bacterium]